MAHKYQNYEPNWFHGKIPANSYRSIFKWGESEKIKAPRESLYKLILDRIRPYQ